MFRTIFFSIFYSFQVDVFIKNLHILVRTFRELYKSHGHGTFYLLTFEFERYETIFFDLFTHFMYHVLGSRICIRYYGLGRWCEKRDIESFWSSNAGEWQLDGNRQKNNAKNSFSCSRTFFSSIVKDFFHNEVGNGFRHGAYELITGIPV